MTQDDERLDKIYAIWWWSQEQWDYFCNLPSDFARLKCWPEYICQAFNYNCSRPPRNASLVQSPAMLGHRRYLDMNSIVGYQTFRGWSIAEDYAPFVNMSGIVVYVEDLWHLHGMPGTFTTRSLKPIEVPAPPAKVEPIVIPPKPEPPKPVEKLPAQYPEPEVEPTASEEPDAQPESPKEPEEMFDRVNPGNWNSEPKPGFLGVIQRNPIKAAFAAIAALFVLVMLFNSVYTINETERGVVLAGGKLSKVEEPGIHFKLPGYHEIKRISLQTWTDKFERLEAYSNDQQAASMQVSVTWTANPAMVAELYRTALNLDQVTARFIRPKTPSEVENTFGQFTAEKLVQDRTQFVLALTESIRRNVPAFVQIESVQVENVNFSDAYEATIEEKAKAEVATATAAKKEARAVIDARAYVAQQQALATAKKNQMLAEAEGIREKGKAEADAIIAKANALKNNPQLIELIEAERWNGSRATTIYGQVQPTVQVK